MVAFWKDSFDEGGLAWDDATNNRAFLSGTICSTLNGASIYIEITRKPDQYKTGRRQAAQGRHPARAAAGGPEGPVRLPHLHLARDAELLEEREGGEGPAALHPQEGELRPVVHDRPGFYTPGTTGWENHALWEQEPGHGAVRGRRQARPDARLPGRAERQGGRGADEVPDRQHVRLGDQGPERRGGGQGLRDAS